MVCVCVCVLTFFSSVIIDSFNILSLIPLEPANTGGEGERGERKKGERGERKKGERERVMVVAYYMYMLYFYTFFFH